MKTISTFIGVGIAASLLPVVTACGSSSSPSPTPPPSPRITVTADGQALSPAVMRTVAAPVILRASLAPPAAGSVGLVEFAVVPAGTTDPVFTWKAADCLSAAQQGQTTWTPSSTGSFSIMLSYAFDAKRCPENTADAVQKLTGKITVR